MSSDTEQYRVFIQRLQREEFRPAALNDIKNLLAFKPSGEASSVIRGGGISEIVQCLNAQDKTHVDLTCEVLRMCFDKFEVGDVIRNYIGHVMYLLRHEKSCVRRIAVDEVSKAVMTDVSLLPVPQFIDVFVAVAQLVSDSDIGVANKSILVTSNLCLEAYPKVLDEMKIALEYGSSSKCNAFEVIINISSKSVELLQLSVEQGYLDHLISELRSDDVLYQMNILELVSRLAITPHGINFFVKQGVLQKISDLVSDLPNNPLNGLLTPGYLKFFGAIAHEYPQEVFARFPVLLDVLFGSLETEDQNILPIALDTLGNIGSTIEGKLCLAALGSKYIQAVEKVGILIRTGASEIKVRALHCYASLIGVEAKSKVPPVSPIDHRVTLMTREWFRSLSTQPGSMEILFDICKNPFPDIRSGGFTVLDAVCQHQWGEELVARTAGFIEYLLDRAISYPKVLKELKFDIIKRLSNSAAFEPSIASRLQLYVEQGPFYSETEMQVATEDGD